MSRTNFLTPEIAKQLSDQSEGNDLDLSFVENINPEVASIIAMHKGLVKGGAGMLILDGLVEVSSEVAVNLSEYEGPLSLNGLPELSEELAVNLSSHYGTLILNGLESINEEVADKLRDHCGTICLNGLIDLNVEVARCLSKHSKDMKWVLSLLGIQSLSDTVAKELSNYQGILQLPEEFEKKVFSHAKHFEILNDNIISIYKAAMSESYWRYDQGYDETTWDSLPDEFAKYRSITDSAADSLSDEFDNLNLSGLLTISKSSAKALLNCKESIQLNGLTKLEKGTAEIFSTYEGEISLIGLSKLTYDEAVFLSNIPEDNLHVSKEIATQIRTTCKNIKSEDVNSVNDSVDLKTKSKEQKKEKSPEKNVDSRIVQGGLPQGFLDFFN